MKNIFTSSNKLPDDFVRIPDFDTVFLYETFGYLPFVSKEKSGRVYIYFDTTDKDKLAIVRKMGFKPHRYINRKDKPKKLMYRAPISVLMQQSAWNVANKIRMTYSAFDNHFLLDAKKYQRMPKYKEYIQTYKSNVKQKTK